MPLPILAAAVAAACSLSHPATCRDTNQLANAPDFRAGITRFLGRRRADYLYHGHTVAEQAIDVLFGPPDNPTRDGGSFVFTACRAHSCPEKGALVVSPAGRIQAVAILYSGCGIPHPASDCPSHNRLAVYSRDAPAAAMRRVRSWATEQVAGMYVVPGQPRATLDGTQVIPVR